MISGLALLCSGLAVLGTAFAIYGVLKLRRAFHTLCATVIKLCDDLKIILSSDILDPQPKINNVTYVTPEELEALLKGQGLKKDLK